MGCANVAAMPDDVFRRFPAMAAMAAMHDAVNELLADGERATAVENALRGDDAVVQCCGDRDGFDR